MSNGSAALLSRAKENYDKRKPEEMSLSDYLDICRNNPEAYASPAERLLKAIGSPEVVDTARDARLSRIYQNRQITRYPAFSDFYGAEKEIQAIVDHLRHASQGLEEKKQVLYLLGPVGGGKSSLAERLKELMQKEPFYAIVGSPVNENPLGILASDPDLAAALTDPNGPYKINPRYLKTHMSPWAAKRLKEFDGDITKFRVAKIYPSILQKIAISSTEPGDDNNQDISALVGKVDVRKMERFAQDDPDAYSYAGGLCTANRGLMEFIEMFKAPIKVLHPLLTATQEGHFQGTEQIGAIPFDGVILAHSNESEWKAFSGNPKNEAFLDRVNIVKVPYCLQVDEEIRIYEKMLANSDLAKAPRAPGTLRMMAEFAVLSRLKDHENSKTTTKMRVYNGENLKEIDPKVKTIAEYRDKAGLDEGMTGFSTRSAFKVLSKVFNFNSGVGGEVAANPIHLMYVLEQEVMKKQLPADIEKRSLGFIKEWLQPEYAKALEKEIRTAYLESYEEYGQNLFDRYIRYADLWVQDKEYRDGDTGEILDRTALDAELAKIEKASGIANPKDFRNEVVNYVLRARANSKDGQNPKWTDYEKMRSVIEKRMFTNTEEILPIISFSAKSSEADRKKHQGYVDRMISHGYTPQQVRLVSEWWLKHRLSS